MCAVCSCLFRGATLYIQYCAQVHWAASVLSSFGLWEGKKKKSGKIKQQAQESKREEEN